jgi:hypothetical protein
MKTNLIFKRQETIEGVTKVVTKVIPVEVPFINSGEGWVLSGHTDIIEIMTPDELENIPITAQVNSVSNEPIDKGADVTVNLEKFVSDVTGTAKLVRSRGVIKIVARRGKSTYNQTTPNSVCIDDCTKNNFFKDCRAFYGNNGCYEFTDKAGKLYDYWNDVIDKEYMRQKKKATSTT